MYLFRRNKGHLAGLKSLMQYVCMHNVCADVISAYRTWMARRHFYFQLNILISTIHMVSHPG